MATITVKDEVLNHLIKVEIMETGDSMACMDLSLDDKILARVVWTSGGIRLLGHACLAMSEMIDKHSNGRM